MLLVMSLSSSFFFSLFQLSLKNECSFFFFFFFSSGKDVAKTIEDIEGVVCENSGCARWDRTHRCEEKRENKKGEREYTSTLTTLIVRLSRVLFFYFSSFVYLFIYYCFIIIIINDRFWLSDMLFLFRLVRFQNKQLQIQICIKGKGEK